MQVFNLLSRSGNPMKCGKMASKKERTILLNRPTPATIDRIKIASFEFSGILYLPSISFKSEI